MTIAKGHGTERSARERNERIGGRCVMWVNLWRGLLALGNGPALLYLFGGSITGMIVGVVPGLSGAVILSVVLVFVYHIDIIGTLCLFLGTLAGSYYSASVTSILLNTPAHPEAFAITFDGFPMAQRGEPGRALGLSAASTCLGGIIGCAVFVGFTQVLNQLPGLFHPPEYVALVVLAMLLVGTLGTDSVGKALAAAGAGLMVASIGSSSISGSTRFTFGSVALIGGVSLVSLALGVFAIPQMAMVFGTGTAIARQDMTGRELEAATPVVFTRGFGRQLIGGVFETFRHWRYVLQGGLTGALTGLVPGIGGFATNFLSYGIAKQISSKRSTFGTGAPEGIVAPESASLAKEAGTMIPIIGLGVPGSVGGALFLAALAVKGIRTGYGFTTQYPILPYEIMWVIAFSGVVGTAVGVLVGPSLAKVTRVPGPVIVPFVFTMAVLGPFLADASFYSVMEMFIFGIVGIALRRLRFPLASFILGLVLGPTFENNIYLTRTLYRGDSFLLDRPMADVLFAISIAVLVLKTIEVRREKRQRRAAFDERLASIPDEGHRLAAREAENRLAHPYPYLSVIVTAGLLAISLYFVVYGSLSYTFVTALMPAIGGSAVAIPMIIRLPGDVTHLVQHVRLRSAQRRTEVPLSEPFPVSSVARHASAGGDVDEVDLLGVMRTSPDVVAGPASQVQDKSWGPNGQYRRELTAFAWLVALIVLCWVLGFVWGAPVFVAAYGVVSARRFFPRRAQHLLFVVFSTAAVWAVAYESIKLTHLVFHPKINF